MTQFAKVVFYAFIFIKYLYHRYIQYPVSYENIWQDDHGADLVKNFRNVQALNGREVSFYSSMEKIVAPMEELPVPEVKSAGDEEPVTEEETPSKITLN